MSRALTVAMPAALLTCHSCVLGAVSWLALTLGLQPLAATAVLLLCATPLLLALRGLRAASRYTQQWVAIALVFYVGIGLAEMIASQGQSLAASALLLAGATEFILLLRRLRTPSSMPPESAES